MLIWSAYSMVSFTPNLLDEASNYAQIKMFGASHEMTYAKLTGSCEQWYCPASWQSVLTQVPFSSWPGERKRAEILIKKILGETIRTKSEREKWDTSVEYSGRFPVMTGALASSIVENIFWEQLSQ